MWSLYKKELRAFFSTLIGYLSIGLFLLMTGLLLWVFPNMSILDNEFATVEPLFYIAPYVFMFLIPAITMSSYSEEKQSGTFELLVSRPLTDIQIAIVKLLAAFTLVVIALLPTLIYVYTVYQLGSPAGNIDLGQVLGSYIGLLFLAATFVSIGLFGSALSKNQVVGFITAFFLCFLMYSAFEWISKVPSFIGQIDDFIERLGIAYHYDAMNSGLLDSRNAIYFISMIVFFFMLSQVFLAKRNWS